MVAAPRARRRPRPPSQTDSRPRLRLPFSAPFAPRLSARRVPLILIACAADAPPPPVSTGGLLVPLASSSGDVLLA